MNKMSLEEFRRIRNRIVEIFNLDGSKLTPEEEEKLVSEYYAMLDELASHDLSDIPFEEWKGVALVKEGYLDFSKTHANLDFSIMGESGFEKVNLNGCNVRGLEYVRYEADTFDQEFKDAHPEFFPSKDLPQEIIDKYYSWDLSFQDLIDYPSLKTCIHGNNFGGNTKRLIGLIGYDYALRMLEEYEDLILHITKEHSSSLDSFNFSRDIKFEGSTYEEAKETVFKTIIYNVEFFNYNLDLMNSDLIPEEMKKNHPEVFFDDSELPQEIVEKYRNGRLSIWDIRNHFDVLKNKNINIGFRSNYDLQYLVKLFGSIEKALEELPPELYGAVMHYIDKNWWSNRDEIEQLFNDDREEFYKRAIIEYINNSNNYFLRDIHNFSKYIPLERLIGDEQILEFINFFGMENIIKFSDNYDFIMEKTNYDYFSTNYDETFLGFLAKQNAIDYKTYSQDGTGLESLTKDLIVFARNNSNSSYEVLVDRLMAYGKSLSKLSPDLFFDYDLAKELFKDVASYNINSLYKNINDSLSGSFKKLFEVIKEYPQAIQLYEGKKIVFEDYPEFNEIVTVYGLATLLDLCLKYKEVFEYCLTYDRKNIEQMVGYLTKVEDPEKGMNDFIYEFSSGLSKKMCDYTRLPLSFKADHPELFLPDDPNIPDDLRRAFTGMKHWGTYSLISFIDLAIHPEWIPFLDTVDLSRSIEQILVSPIDSTITDVGSYRNYGNGAERINIIDFFCNYLPKRKVLEFLIKYAYLLNENDVIGIPINEIEKSSIEDVFADVIYRRALTRSVSLNEKNVPKEFQDKYPDLFISKDAPEELRNLFYQKMISYDVLMNHPEWDKYIIDKNLYLCLDRNYNLFAKGMHANNLSNKDILFLIRKYGRYLIDDRMDAIKGEGLQDIEEKIKLKMVDLIKGGFAYGEDAIPLVGDIMPDYFLDAAAPQELKDAFYHQNNSALTFDILKQHRDWLGYLEGKDVINSLSKAGYRKYNLANLVRNLGGTKELLILGMKNPDAVNYMIIHNKDDLLLKWYKRAKFVPHCSVMLEFPFEEIDKFLAAGKLWSQIMRIEEFTASNDAVSAMLVAAYVFGVFDGDIEGFNQFMQLFTSIPSRIMEEEYQQMMEKALDGERLEEGKLSPQQEILKRCYYKGEDGSYYLRINPQQDKKGASVVRKLAIACDLVGMLTPHKAHQIFGPFIMKFDPSFREFFMANLDLILDQNNDYYSFMGTIQKRWPEIQASYSNRVLTLEGAKKYVIDHKYDGVEPGNEKLAAVSAEVPYTQESFEKLQEIYNYGKSRVHSSIPRIAGSKGRYSYEILRLDDPYAVAAGSLTKCCQEIGNHAENCMQHSVVSEHGRIFFVRDQDGNYEAQSWVWRNGNVLCFDNIEIPNKAFNRAAALGLSREAYTDEILEIYKQAAKEIIELDEAMYKQLLEAGRITEEQYENMRIRKVTVGIGNNDIKESLIRNVPEDPGKLAGPLPFKPPVALTRDWLYTDDSEEAQHVLAGEMDVKPTGEESLTVYSDEFRVIDKESMTIDIIRSMANLQKHVKGLDYSDFDYYPQDAIMEKIAYNYDLDPETTRVVIHPNFYIIYCVSDGKVVLADILRSGKINKQVNERDITDIVNLQVGLALKQIKGNMEFDTSMLEPDELEIFNQAVSDEKMDSERSFSHGR